MHAQNLFAALDVGVWYCDLAVKTARTQQCRVQNITAVGRRHDDHAFIGLKTIHLDQQLVERLFTFVIAATVTGTTGPTDSVNLVDKYDTWRVLFCLFEHVTNT